MQRRVAAGVLTLVAVLLLAVVVLQSGLWIEFLGVGEYEEGTVTVREGTPANATTTAEQPTATATDTASADSPTVAVRETTDGDTLATVRVRIAKTFEQRYVGLSETDSMGPNEGMLFVHQDEATHAYVMRNMSFELDIIFIAENGTITTIHHAALPPAGTSESELKRYQGRGTYVLEVNRGWANRTGVTVGDEVELPKSIRE